jgi:hypothetical protein
MARVTPPVLAVVGPTAAGKSDLAVEVALRLGGEVVNADSMQLYRGMDVGTAKLSCDERRGVAAPPPRRLGRHRDGERRGVPAPGPRRCRGHPQPGWRARAGGRLRALRARRARRSGLPGTDAAVRERLESELAVAGRRRCTRGSPPPTRPPPRRSCRPTAGAWSGRSRWSSSPAARSRRAFPATPYVLPAVQVGSPCHARSSTRASRAGPGRCSPAAWSRRSPLCCRAGCARGAPLPGRWATRRCCATWTASGPWSGRRRRPYAPPGASPGVRSHGSAATRGCVVRIDEPDLVTRVVERARVG